VQRLNKGWRLEHHTIFMKTSKRRLIGIGLFSAAVLAAAAFQVFGPGLIVTTGLHPATSPALGAQGVDLAGGQLIDFNRLSEAISICAAAAYMKLLGHIRT
jgi:hypothetical protein